MPIKWQLKGKNKMSEEIFMPKNEQKEDEEIIENKEEGGEKYELFKKEAEESKEEKDKTWVIKNLTWGGAEELIKEFGAEKFADAIKEVAEESDKPRNMYMYEVVKVLEPDKKKRQELYKKTIGEDETLLEESKNVVLSNDIKLRLEKIRFFEYLDSLSSLSEKTFLKIQQMLGKKVSIEEEIPFDFKNFGIDLKEQLEKYDGDIKKLLSDRYQENRIRSRDLEEKRLEIINNLHREIEQITMEARIKYLKEENDLLENLETTRMTKPIAEVEISEKIIDAAVASMEKTLGEHYKNVEKEIDELTKEQREMIDEIEKTHI